MKPPTISALVHTRNEEKNIPACLTSLKWADEIVVADMASTDSTRSLAASLGARVIDVPLVENVDMVRNRAIEACTGEWIIVVDADESVPPALAERLRELSQSGTASAYSIPRKNYFLGTWLEHGLWPDHQTRFFRRGGVRWTDLVHEAPVVEGELVRLASDPAVALEHARHAPDLKTYIEKMARWAPLDAQRLTQTTRPAVWPYLIRRPVGEFCGRYFTCGAWRHGMDGLAWSLVIAGYQLQVCLYYWAAHRDESRPAPAELRMKMKREIWREALKSLRH